jgi:hypothetical protein
MDRVVIGLEDYNNSFLKVNPGHLFTPSVAVSNERKNISNEESIFS